MTVTKMTTRNRGVVPAKFKAEVEDGGEVKGHGKGKKAAGGSLGAKRREKETDTFGTGAAERKPDSKARDSRSKKATKATRAGMSASRSESKSKAKSKELKEVKKRQREDEDDESDDQVVVERGRNRGARGGTRRTSSWSTKGSVSKSSPSDTRSKSPSKALLTSATERTRRVPSSSFAPTTSRSRSTSEDVTAQTKAKATAAKQPEVNSTRRGGSVPTSSSALSVATTVVATGSRLRPNKSRLASSQVSVREENDTSHLF